MFKAIFYIILLAIGFSVVWNYLPLNIKNEVTGLGSYISQDNKDSIKELPGAVLKKGVDLVTPENPRDKRTYLIEKLTENVEEIESQFPDSEISGKLGSSTSNSLKATKIKEIVLNSKELLKELERANIDQSVAEKITGKTLDIITPSKVSPDVCECGELKKQ